MAFDVAADAYDRFMGRYSDPLAARMIDLVDVRPGQRVLDVGCGPGVLTRRLVERLGAAGVAAVDPSPPFVEAVQARLPDVDARRSGAEDLPFADDTFDATLAQLVVAFMADPAAGLREMARVTRPGGVVAASAWNHADSAASPLSLFWRAARDLDPGTYDESRMLGSREDDLTRLFERAGLSEVGEAVLTIRVVHETFEEWWTPYTLGVGPAGDYVAALTPDGRDALRDHARRLVGDGPIEIAGSAWCAVGRV